MSDIDRVVEALLDRFVPALGDAAFCDVRGVGGTTRTVARAPGAVAAEALMLDGRWHRTSTAASGICALSTGQTARHARVGMGWRQRMKLPLEQGQLLADVGVCSLLTVPFIFRGEPIAAVTLLMTGSRRRHTANDERAATRLATMTTPLLINAWLAEQHGRADIAWRGREEQLRLAIDAGQLGIWDWDIAHNRVTWSDRVYELHGVEKGTFGGRVEDFAALVHPDDRPFIQQRIEHALRESAEFAVEFRVPQPDGRTRWLATRAEVHRSADGSPQRMIGATYEVTQRVELLAAERAARADMERARKRLELLASTGAVLSRSLDPETTLEAIASIVVPAIADWCRVDLLDAHGTLRRAVTHHSDPAKTRFGKELVDRLRAAPDARGSMAWAVATGQSHVAVFTPPKEFDAIRDRDLLTFAQAIGMRAYFVVPLIARGRTLGAMAALQAESGRHFSDDDCALIGEIAQRAALALDNARLYAEAEASRRAAESASRAKDEFLAILGHELRNPLAPIVTALRLMGSRDTYAAEERGVIERQVAHLLRLVDDLLDVSRITRGKIQLTRQPIDITAVLDDAVEQVRPMIQQRSLVFEQDLPESGLHVQGDRVRLAQVFSNLVANAAKFTPPGGRIRVSGREAGDEIEIVVADSGAGIGPDLLPHVFDLFVQGEQAIDRRQGGLGLGLTIVKMLVELHGGRVAADSAGAGQGSTFRVLLPRARGVVESPVKAPAPARPRAGGRILIVDDNADAADTMATLLAFEGFETRAVGDGQRALSTLADFNAQVAILDIGLPGMSGYELAQRLRRQAPGLRLVALTGYGTQRDHEKSRDAGFDEHLVKPVMPERLLAVLDRLLSGDGR